MHDRRFMKKYAMAVSALFVALSGVAIAGPGLRDPLVLGPVALTAAWADVLLLALCGAALMLRLWADRSPTT